MDVEKHKTLSNVAIGSRVFFKGETVYTTKEISNVGFFSLYNKNGKFVSEIKQDFKDKYLKQTLI